ncbi:ISAs1 family transposase, partial [Sinorhizobium meliloti]
MKSSAALEVSMSRFAACFEDLPDPRGRNARHPLTSILF